MSTSWVDASALRVDKHRAAATLTLSDGQSVDGSFFLADSCRDHTGPEGIKDLLNGDRGFFPFELNMRGVRRTALYNRDHIVYVRLVGNEESHRDPGYDIATRRAVAMLMTNGRRLQGVVRIFCPEGRDRLSDYARSSETFRYLETTDGAFVVNVRHVLALEETELS